MLPPGSFPELTWLLRKAAPGNAGAMDLVEVDELLEKLTLALSRLESRGCYPS